MKVKNVDFGFFLIPSFRALTFFFIVALLCGSGANATIGNDGMLILTENTGAKKQNIQNPQLRMEMIETSTGITISVLYKEKQKQVPDKLVQQPPELIPGGEIKLFFDNNLLTQDFFDTTEFHLEQPVNVELLENGEHTVKCNINTASGEQLTTSIPFTIDASPHITIIPPVDKEKVFDPEVKVQFFGASDDFVGMLEIGVNSQPVQQVPIDNKANNQQVPLSHFIQNRINVARLPQGEHLLIVAATGINGSKAVSYTPFTVDTTPTMSLSRDKDGNFKELTISYLISNQGVSGSLEVYLDHNMIFTHQVRGDFFSLTRKEIEQAMGKYNISPEKHKELTLLVAARTANGVEKWTTVDFN